MSEKLTVNLKTLHCFQNDEEKFDDIFLKFNGKRIWPKDKKHEDVGVNTKHDLSVEIPDLTPNEQVAIEVWDHDVLSPNDLLGTAYIVPDQPGGPYTVDMKPIDDKETARYSIDWEILWPKNV
ncbi:MAG: hypothetical protein ABJF04_09685 [Reichenbachiella sp.]|uniref:hypothetical protein n=1 Tax=Reichenbachiella sp. TaxID=2184521 RepID=UPI0032660896